MRNDRDEVIKGSPATPKGIADPEYWEKDFEDMPWYNKIEKIMELPGTKDMAGVFARSVLKNNRQRTAAVRLAYRHIKFKDNDHQEMLRMQLATTIGEGGVGRLDMLFAGTNLVAPDMYRTARGMQRPRSEREPVYRGSDFRERIDSPHSPDRE